MPNLIYNTDSGEVHVTIEVQGDEVLAKLRDIAQGLGPVGRAAANRRVSDQLFGWVERNFESEGELRGERWQDLKLGGRWKGKGKNRYLETEYMILQDTGNLRQSFHPFYDEGVAGVGARASFDVDYALMHEFGNPERNLPARPMLPTDEEALAVALDIYNHYVWTLTT